jgi:hypothetical protein
MSEIDNVGIQTKKLECLLKQQYHAEGEGLAQLISSCERRLPHELIPPLREVAAIEEVLTDYSELNADQRQRLIKQCEQCIQALTPRAERFVWRVVWLMLIMMTFGSLMFYYFHWDVLSEHLFN